MSTLFLEKRGMDNNELSDIKNYRVNVVGLIQTTLHTNPIYIEFQHCDMHKMRYTHKTTGKELKHPKWESVNPNGLHIDTCVTDNDGLSFRFSDFEKNIWNLYLDYNTKSILKVINKISKEYYNKVVFVDDAAAKIIQSIGGFREKEILQNDPVFSIGSTWNSEHKIVKVYSRKNNKIDNSCEVDIVTNKITG